MKNLKNNFDENVDKIILLFSSILFLLTFIVLSLIYFRLAISILICYVVSVIIFIKNNYIITKAIKQELAGSRFWMNFNNIINMILYILVILLLAKIEYFTLFGVIGLFYIALVTIIIGIIKRK